MDDEEIITSTEKEGVEIFFFPDEPNGKEKRQSKRRENENSPPLETELKNVEQENLYSELPTEYAEEAKPTNIQVAKELGDPTAAPKRVYTTSTSSAKSSKSTTRKVCY